MSANRYANAGPIMVALHDGRGLSEEQCKQLPKGTLVLPASAFGPLSPAQNAELHQRIVVLEEALRETLAVATRNEEGEFADRARAALRFD